MGRIPALVAATVMLGIGTVAFGIGVRLLIEVLVFRRSSVLVKGRYVGDKRTRARGASTGLDQYQIQASFLCPFLKTKRLATAGAASNAQSLREVGDYVPILVSTEIPHHARIGTFSNLFLAPIALITFGVATTLLVAICIVSELS